MIMNRGSFRDPLGTIYEKNNRVFRKVETVILNFVIGLYIEGSPRKLYECSSK